MKPTDEQVRDFWEWCGFYRGTKKLTGASKYYKEQPDAELAVWLHPQWKGSPNLPPIDLNNLFKYAVPKLDQSRYYKALSSIFYYDAIKDDPVTALFWAIYEVMK